MLPSTSKQWLLVVLLLLLNICIYAKVAVETDDNESILDLDDDTDDDDDDDDTSVGVQQRPRLKRNDADDDAHDHDKGETKTTTPSAAADTLIVEEFEEVKNKKHTSTTLADSEDGEVLPMTVATATTYTQHIKESDDDDDDDDDVGLPTTTTDDDDSSTTGATRMDDSPVTTTTTRRIRQDLLHLTNDELSAVCLERGFEIHPTSSSTGSSSDDPYHHDHPSSTTTTVSRLTREDLLEAATRCIQLEQEMNTVLDDHPELALELEAEIERMKQEKERLEIQQGQLLQEKAMLEQQLREAGIDLPEIMIKNHHQHKMVSPKQQDAPSDSFLRTSSVMLCDRVGRDLLLVGNVLGYVAKPGMASLAVVWRYIAPTVEGLVQQIWIGIDNILSIPMIVSFRKRILGPLFKDALWPLTKSMLLQVQSEWSKLWPKLNTIESIHQGTILFEVMLGPLQDSLGMWWRTTIQPNLFVMRGQLDKWWKRLRREVQAKQNNHQQNELKKDDNLQ